MLKVKLKVSPFKVEYSIIKSKGMYGIRITEYNNGSLAKIETFSGLTKNEDEINFILNVFSENEVFIIHANDILKEMGYKTTA